MQEAYDDVRADFNAAKQTRFRRRRSGVAAQGSGADYHYRNETEWLRMMELARDIDRNDVVVGQGINRLIDNILQTGIQLDPATGDESLDADLRARWQEWCGSADNCDVAKEAWFGRLERQALRQAIVDGDCFCLPMADGSVQLIEAHRARTPRNTRRNVVHGVLLDEQTRERLQVWFTRDEVDPQRAVARVSDIQPINVRDDAGHRQVWQVYNPNRTSQTRGYTHLAPIADVTGMHDDIQFATLVAKQMVSCFAIIRERQQGWMPPGGQGSAATGARTSTSYSDGGARINEGIHPGMTWEGMPNEKLTGFSPNIPNPEFFPHAMMILTFIAINLNIPVAVLLLDPSQTNFSGWRGAMDQARVGFRVIQQWFTQCFHRPIYEWKVRQWIGQDQDLDAAALSGGVNIFGHKWNPPTWQYIEPMKDAAADDLRQRANLISARRRAAERGLDWDDLAEEIPADRAKLIEHAVLKAQELKKRFPEELENLDWRELAYGFQHSGIKYVFGATLGDDEGPADDASPDKSAPPNRQPQESAA